MKIRCGTTKDVMESVDIVDPNTIKSFFAPNLIQKYEFKPFKCLFPVCCTKISYFAVDENLSQTNHQNLQQAKWDGNRWYIEIPAQAPNKFKFFIRGESESESDYFLTTQNKWTQSAVRISVIYDCNLD